MPSKPKNWDALSTVEQEAWQAKQRGKDRKYYEANRERKREKDRKYYEANPEKQRERKLKYYEANPEKQREQKRKYREANREKLRKKSLKSYYKTLQQTAADQFFIMAGAAEQLTKLKPKQ